MNRTSLRVGVSALALAFVAGAQTGQAQAGPEQKRLDSFAGKWRIEMEIKATPSAPASKATGTDDCEWFANMHMVCKSDAGVFRSMRTISYVPAVKQYAMYSVDSYGYASYTLGQVQGNTWTFATELGGVKYRFVTETSRNGYSTKVEYAGADGKWVGLSETKATKTQ